MDGSWVVRGGWVMGLPSFLPLPRIRPLPSEAPQNEYTHTLKMLLMIYVS